MGAVLASCFVSFSRGQRHIHLAEGLCSPWCIRSCLPCSEASSILSTSVRIKGYLPKTLGPVVMPHPRLPRICTRVQGQVVSLSLLPGQDEMGHQQISHCSRCRVPLEDQLCSQVLLSPRGGFLGLCLLVWLLPTLLRSSGRQAVGVSLSPDTCLSTSPLGATPALPTCAGERQPQRPGSG